MYVCIYVYYITAALAVLPFFLHRLLFVVSEGFSQESTSGSTGDGRKYTILYCIITAAPKLQQADWLAGRACERKKTYNRKCVKNYFIIYDY